MKHIHSRLINLYYLQKPHKASCTGTSLYRNLLFLSSNISYVQSSPITAAISQLRLPDAFIANFAPFLISQLCFSSKAASQAEQSTSDMLLFGSALSSKVTLMKVNSHIMRSRFLAVELYFLNYFAALCAELLSPLSTCIPFCIQRRTKDRKPRYPLNVQLLLRMIVTFDCTSEKAIPRKEFNAEKTRQN